MTAISIAIVIGCCLIAATSAFQQNACLGAPNPGLLFAPSPVSCDAYVRCLNGGITQDRCDPGLHFNAVNQECRTAGQVDCTTCARTGIVNRPDPQNCRAFIECNFGWRTARLCGQSQLFDRRIGQCNQAHLVQCAPGGQQPGGNPPQPVCPQGVQVNLPHWNDCSRFYECWFGQRTARQCGGGFLFDVHQRQCVRAHLATCNGGGGGNPPPPPPPPPQQPGQCPQSGTTAVAHPTDCTRYFRCVNGISFAERCPNTAPHFNEARRTCDSVQNARCWRG